MALGWQEERQGDSMVTWREMPRSPAHVFYRSHPAGATGEAG